jgi:hypothetical protein
MVVILSDDHDFYPVLAEQLERQLGLASQQARSEAEVKQWVDSCRLLVSDLPLSADGWPCPCLEVPNMPVRLHDLLAQIEAIVHKASLQERLDLPQGCQLEILNKRVVHAASGRNADITDKELQLLRSLLVAGGQGVSREILRRDVWGFDETVDTHTLETHIYRLRAKLRDVAGSDTIIEAMDGGYRLAM